MSKRYLPPLLWALAVVIPDQLSKVLVREEIPLWTTREVIPGFFNLSHVLNKGAAFGFLNRSDTDWQTWFLIGVTVVAVAFILVLLRGTGKGDGLLVAGLGLILGGAVGNLIDRLTRGGMVTDFLDFYFGTYHWPSFNLADTGITIGAGAAILHYILNRNASDTD